MTHSNGNLDFWVKKHAIISIGSWHKTFSWGKWLLVPADSWSNCLFLFNVKESNAVFCCNLIKSDLCIAAKLYSGTQISLEIGFQEFCLDSRVVEILLIVIPIIEVLNFLLATRSKESIDLSILSFGKAEEDDRTQVNDCLDYQNWKHDDEDWAKGETELALMARHIF